MNIANWLYQSAKAWPDNPAVFDGLRQLNDYAGLVDAVCARARHLRARYGIAPGERVAIFAKNAPDYIGAIHACWWLGATAVPINHKLHPGEAEWIIGDSGAKLVLTDDGNLFPGRAGLAEEALARPPAEAAPVDLPHPAADTDTAWLFYTSGTTGRPKGVMITHDNLRHMALCYALDVDQPAMDSHMLYAAPMSHGAGIYMLPQIRAAGRHLIPASRGFDSGEIIALAAHPGKLVFFAAPTMVKRLIAAARGAGFAGEGIETIVYGGGPMYGNDIDEALAQFGPRFVQVYGQGESPMTISVLPRALVADQAHPRWQTRRNSVGYAQGCVTLAVLGPDDARLAPGETGEICVRGPSVMRGYWRKPEATAETLRGGWLHTGDLGHLDEDGFLYLTDRSKDVIISGGTNIYPREVEEALLLHPAVFEVAVIGEPEPEWGEQVVACVVLAPGRSVETAELDSWCRQHIAAFKRPKRYLFLADLPKNGYGKILKTELRAGLRAGA